MNAKQFAQIYEELYGDSEQGKKKNLEEMAAELSRLAGRDRNPWSWRALNNILMGYTASISEELATALRMLATRIDTTSPLQALPLREIRAFSVNGHVRGGSIVLGSSKRCVGCGALFVPNVPWRKWCMEECRLRESA